MRQRRFLNLVEPERGCQPCPSGKTQTQTSDWHYWSCASGIKAEKDKGKVKHARTAAKKKTQKFWRELRPRRPDVQSLVTISKRANEARCWPNEAQEREKGKFCGQNEKASVSAP